MEYTHLGRTGLLVSRLCLGTMAFGNSTDEKESFRIMDEALDLGINFFDSADNYGKATNNEGITEKIIGKWFAQGGGRRQLREAGGEQRKQQRDSLHGVSPRL